MAETTTYSYADDYWNGDAEMGEDFDRWIRELDEDVIQAEFGYEDGEFDVFPSLWWSLYHRRLPPREAWLVALEEHRKARDPA